MFRTNWKNIFCDGMIDEMRAHRSNACSQMCVKQLLCWGSLLHVAIKNFTGRRSNPGGMAWFDTFRGFPIRPGNGTSHSHGAHLVCLKFWVYPDEMEHLMGNMMIDPWTMDFGDLISRQTHLMNIFSLLQTSRSVETRLMMTLSLTRRQWRWHVLIVAWAS